MTCFSHRVRSFRQGEGVCQRFVVCENDEWASFQKVMKVLDCKVHYKKLVALCQKRCSAAPLVLSASSFCGVVYLKWSTTMYPVQIPGLILLNDN